MVVLVSCETSYDEMKVLMTLYEKSSGKNEGLNDFMRNEMNEFLMMKDFLWETQPDKMCKMNLLMKVEIWEYQMIEKGVNWMVFKLNICKTFI